ncbi:glycosyltransferase family 87 protein [Paraburkholderia sp. J12]|uniref:glycosyltransferase family 87 protein n=1 Tax=Paraburkholderia sp. J12 TaxID=2805432 RepID=UPI002ABDB68D|nr:glycosyltransferase family 87 protein [Paraburkholderia sp. J12]
MDLSIKEAIGARRPVRTWITRSRVRLYSLATLALYAVFLVVWSLHSTGFTDTGIARPATDFSVFWAASHVMLHGASWQAYDPTTFASIERALFGNRAEFSLLPWLYPPTFLLVVTPLSLLPLPLSYALATIAGLVAFSWTVMRLSGLASTSIGRDVGVLALVASPGAFVAALYGQNSLLTAALVATAILWLDRRPVFSGIFIGLLSIKPQMALLFPFVLIATRAWRTFICAAVTASLFTLVSALICGTQTIALFLAGTRFVRESILERNDHFWRCSPTAFAALRSAGLPQWSAYAVQALVACVAIGVACSVWRGTRDVRLRAAVFVIATLLANPYVWHYELAWLGVALAALFAAGLSEGWLRGEQTLLAAGWLLPLFELANSVAGLPQAGVVVLLLMLMMVLRRQRLMMRARP